MYNNPLSLQQSDRRERVSKISEKSSILWRWWELSFKMIFWEAIYTMLAKIRLIFGNDCRAQDWAGTLWGHFGITVVLVAEPYTQYLLGWSTTLCSVSWETLVPLVHEAFFPRQVQVGRKMLKGKAVTKIQQEDGIKHGPSCNWCQPGWSFVYGDYNVCNRRPGIRGSIVQFFGGMGARIPPQHSGINHLQTIVSGAFGCCRLLHSLAGKGDSDEFGAVVSAVF